MTEEPLTVAQRAVRRAQQYEELGDSEKAEDYYRAAQVLYIEAGVDYRWFDVRCRNARQCNESDLNLYWLADDDLVELTEEFDASEPSGVIIALSDLSRAEP